MLYTLEELKVNVPSKKYIANYIKYGINAIKTDAEQRASRAKKRDDCIAALRK